MFIDFLRHNKYVSYVLLTLRLYIGYQWLTAGYGKLTSGGFDAAGYLQGAIQGASGDHPSVLGWWASFLQHVALPNIELFNFLVSWGELLVGLGLIVGCFTRTAIFFGMMMNFAFMFSGSAGVNPLLILLSMFIIVSGSNAGRIGVDYIIQKRFVRYQEPRQRELKAS